jgi:hypothetical protein
LDRISEPSPRTIQRNLLKIWNSATLEEIIQGNNWYFDARNKAAELAWKYNSSVDKVCGVIAALSPGRSWELNLQDAEDFLREYSQGSRGRNLPRVGSYGRLNVKKAERICNGEEPLSVLGGQKVRNFYQCLVDPENSEACCLDRHMKSAAWGRRLPEIGWAPEMRLGVSSLIRPAEYQRLKEHVVRAAEKVGVLPLRFQATIWCRWRKLKP